MISFICNSCKSGADSKPSKDPVFQAMQLAMHKKCKGGSWCDCQHRVAK